MKTLEQILTEIKAIHIQGAKEIAIESLKFLRAYAKKEGFGAKFNSACTKLEKARPTAVVLHNAIELIKKKPSNEAITKLISQLNSMTKRIAQNGAPLIKNGCVILTHCHSGEALSVIKEAAKTKKIKVIATITEPKHQGLKTAKELKDAGIDVTLIEDSAAGFFMKDIDLVLTGSDAFRNEGNVNKIGTYLIAMAAWNLGKDYFVAGNSLKLDRRKKIEIEERPSIEISGIKGVRIKNPAFDITIWKYIKKVITDKGVMTPGNLKKLLK